MPLPKDEADDINRFFATVKSLNELNRLEVHNVVNNGLLGLRTNRENYFLLNYNRAVLNIELLLSLTEYKHFQTVASIARTTFEIAVEMAMMERDKASDQKITAFIEAEKLRSARKIESFGKHRPDPTKGFLYSVYIEFIQKNAARIDAECLRIWGPGKVKHWTRKDVAGICKELGGEFEELYSFHYAELSWFIHSGVIGVANVDEDTMARLCGVAFQIIVKCYSLILEAIMNCFQMYHADDKLKKKLVVARMLPFTESERERGAVWRAGLA
jgi:hypothetical protein